MLISKFDLYKPEWLELVFENRNKDYGAYDLRQHYTSNVVRAMGITFVGVAVLFGASVIFRTHPVPVAQVPQDPIIRVVLHPENPPLVPPRRVETPRVSPPAQTTRSVPPIVVPDPQVTTPTPTIVPTAGAVGQTTTTGDLVDPGIIEPTVGTRTTPVVDNSVHPTKGLDVMPQPVGGDKAWAKFLNSNLRFPYQAQQEGASGKVTLSFIIEKNGSLSNIVVYEPAGHGFDEEALRVLKMAKAWRPGMQNGQPVRVRFSIPINFQGPSE